MRPSASRKVSWEPFTCVMTPRSMRQSPFFSSTSARISLCAKSWLTIAVRSPKAGDASTMRDLDPACAAGALCPDLVDLRGSHVRPHRRDLFRDAPLDPYVVGLI